MSAAGIISALDGHASITVLRTGSLRWCFCSSPEYCWLQFLSVDDSRLLPLSIRFGFMENLRSEERTMALEVCETGRPGSITAPCERADLHRSLICVEMR